MEVKYRGKDNFARTTTTIIYRIKIMRILSPLAATIAIVLSSASVGVMANNDLSALAAASPSFVKGNLGLATSANTVAVLKQILAADASYRVNGNEAFTVKEQWTDELGKRHTRVNQTINGLKVYGTSMVVHADVSEENANSPMQDAGSIYAISGRAAVNAAPVKIRKTDRKVLQLAAELGDVQGKPELAYVYLPLQQLTKLAWKVELSWDNGGNDFGQDLVFFDADSREVLTRHAQVHQAKNWSTYDLKNATENEAPGTFLCSNNNSCADSSAQRAHDGASDVYDYYKARFNRNSIDGNDMTMKSSVHTRTNYNNAFWWNGQMFYGDGDGSQFTDLTKSLDVIGHELTHGVTERTANLVYANASGALNEGWSDILGVAAESYKTGRNPDWKLGEEVYLAGTALRYMNNPTQDGYSTDWYPDRIPFASNPGNNNDQGGVHGNSGIANLAFVLAVDGGTHPRGKSSANVPGIGLAKAEQIFYRALTVYMNSSTDFAGARTATAQAAQDLYGASDKTAIETAWCAVGVGACPGVDVDPINVSASNFSVPNKGWKRYTYTVPAGYTSMTVTLSGGSGDADLYITNGRQSTTSSYDCRSWNDGNSESCTINSSVPGKWYLDAYGYSAASGVTLNLTAK
jgi:Zn-dependent metalloprotease